MANPNLAERKEKLRTLIEKWKLGVMEIIDNTSDDAQKCWVDGSNCPFGNPNGKFTEAPVGFCKGCRIFDDHGDLFDEEDQIEEEELEQEIREKIAGKAVSVQDLLNKLAEDACSGKSQKELKKILKESIRVVSRELKLEQKMIIEEDEVLSSKEEEVKNEK